MRLRRLCILSATLLAFAVPAHGAEGSGQTGEAIDIRAWQVILSHENPQVDRVDSVRFMGGLDLRSSDGRFGGISGLEISEDGKTLTSVTDRGNWFVAHLVYDEVGHLRDLTDGRILPIRGLNGEVLTDRQATDAESLARLPDGSYLVGFEHMHRLDRFRVPGGTAERYRAPVMLAGSPPNGGPEALTLLSDGRLLVLSEQLEAKPGIAAGWMGTAGDWRAVGFRRTGLFVPVGAATRDDGAVFMLERRFTPIGGVGTRVSLVQPGMIKPGAVFEGRELLQLAAPLVADNFEGISVRRGKAGETLIYIVSDDNFNDLQRNLLLLFALDP